MKKYWLFFLFFALASNAQKYELGKIAKEELLEKQHPIDSSAAAAFLFKKARTYFYYSENKGFVSETEFEIKIKIYKKEGLKWANYEVPYYIGWNELNKDNVYFSEAVTYNLENGEIKKTKLTSEGNLKVKINEYWNKKTITMPNVKVGSVFEFKYKIISENISKLPDFEFQDYIPVNYAKFTSEIPVNYQYKTMLRGYLQVEHTSKDENFSQSFNDKYNQTKFLNYLLRKQNYILKNVPKLEEEIFIDNIENYRSKLENELELIVFPETEPKKFSETWDDIAKNIYANEKFKNELNEGNYFEKDLKINVSDTLSDENKIKSILKYVKLRMKWDGFYGYYPKKGVKEAYQERTGNIAEINFILISMLNHARFNANPVLLSTRKNGTAPFPNRDGFNYVIAAVDIDGKQLLLDATDANLAINILPIRCLNGTGRLIRQNGTSEEIQLNPTFLSKNTTMIQGELESNGSFKGKLRTSKTDYLAFDFRDDFAGLSVESYIEKLEKDYYNMVISEYKLENENAVDKPIVESFSFVEANSCEFIGSKMLFNPLLFLTKSINPLKAETRKLPIDFIFSQSDKTIINITIPTGFEVEYLPKSITMITPDNGAVYKFSIQSEKNKIQITTSLDLNSIFFDPQEYQDIKKIFNTVAEKNTEKIILKKIE
ncbi:MAG TPA: DUF3857 domain-containing protein [Flavobacterium sp.]|nr:DUF3857 domain-containing protein [Flavobacterium sp.]